MVPVPGLLGLVGLDAADVMRDALLQLVDEGVGLRPDLASCSRRSFPGAGLQVVREDRSQEVAGMGGEERRRERRVWGRGKGGKTSWRKWGERKGWRARKECVERDEREGYT